MSFEDTIRNIVREEVRAAVTELCTLGPSPSSTLYTLEQLAKVGNVSVTSLRRLRGAGHLVAFGRGRLARYTLDGLQKALAKRAPSTSPAQAQADRILRGMKGGRS